jgi:protein-S-isoprenylcysteine O-methyltransferase Ste14
MPLHPHTPAHLDAPAMIAIIAAALNWLGFAIILVLGKKGASRAPAKNETRSHIGFLLQCAGYGICFAFHRPFFSPLVPASTIGDTTLAALAVVIALVSNWFCFAAARTLGKQWALVARVVQGHELVQQGPYSVVRNPIYLAMLGTLLATGLAVSYWQALILGAVVFWAGTEIRIRTEETLLREAFGPKFEEYARRVPAFFPRIF